MRTIWCIVGALLATSLASTAFAAPALDINAASAAPGTIASIAVTLTRNGAAIASTSNDIGFDSTVLTINPATDCTLAGSSPPWNLAAGKVCHSGNTHACSVDGDCTGTHKPPCDVVRVGTYSNPTTTYDTDGVLVTCGFAVDPSAASNTYPLSNKASAYDVHGNLIRGTTGAAGSITIP